MALMTFAPAAVISETPRVVDATAGSAIGDCMSIALVPGPARTIPTSPVAAWVAESVSQVSRNGSGQEREAKGLDDD